MSIDIQPVRIFIAYAREDDAAREKLRRQLGVLERRGHFQIFWDGLIKPGERWDDRLKAELHHSDIFLLLVSEYFLDSDYVHEVELPKVLELHKAGKAKIFPVILRDCLWRYTELTDFQCVLHEGIPIEQSNGYAYVAQLVAESAKQMNSKRLEENAQLEQEEILKNQVPNINIGDVLDREKALRALADHETWEFAEEADTEAAYRRYLKNFPRGWHMDQAHAKLENIKKRREGEDRFDDPFADLMIPIKGGSFEMGDTFGDGRIDETPVHQVTIPDFHLCKYLVTQAQWTAIMGDNPSHFKGENLPVEKVSWEDVQAFLKKLNEKTGQDYRLPSEAEWEYAAREGGKKVRFGNGKNIADPREINFDARKAYNKTHSRIEFRNQTTPVGAFPANGLGLYDMSGNVWEWCQDIWNENYKNALHNGQAWEQGGNSGRRVLRGGSWVNSYSDCRLAARYGSDTDGRDNNYGFRLARH